MGDKTRSSAKKLAKAVARLRAAADERRRYARGTPEYDEASAEEERLSRIVVALAQATIDDEGKPG